MRGTVLGCCAVVLLASGCGGSHSSPAAFRTRADTICRRLGLANGSTVNTKAALDRGIRHAEAGLGELARLHPPTGDERAYRDMIASLNRTMALGRTRFPALIAASHRSKPPSPQTIERIVRPLERDVRRAAADARAVGLGACARSISPGSSTASVSQPQEHGPTPQQVKSPAKRAFDRKMVAVHERYDNELSTAGAPFMAAFHHGHRAIEKAMFTTLREEARVYRDEASAFAQINAPADAQAEQQVIVDALRQAAAQAGEASVLSRHPHSGIGRFVHYDWQGRFRAAVRRLEAKGYALGALESIGDLTFESSTKIVSSNQP